MKGHEVPLRENPDGLPHRDQLFGLPVLATFGMTGKLHDVLVADYQQRRVLGDSRIYRCSKFVRSISRCSTWHA